MAHFDVGTHLAARCNATVCVVSDQARRVHVMCGCVLSHPPNAPANPPGQQSIIASLKRVLFGLMVFTVLTSLLLQAILKTGGPGKVVVPAAGGALLEEDEPPQRSPYPKSLNGIRQEGCVVMMLLLLLLLLLLLARSQEATRRTRSLCALCV